MNSADVLQCYNKGCSKSFRPSENHSTACTFHPGEPYFHDAYKEWTCCKKKSVDFTEFLNYKGCRTHFHNNVKPVEPEKPKPVETVEEVIVVKPREPMPRPDTGQSMIRLPAEVTPSLKKALAEQLSKIRSAADGDGENKDIVKPGDPCQNRGCGKKYEGLFSNHETCVFHPGLPVFHEGMKYWSCCQKKTSEFDVFLKQEGCETGDHVWRKSAEEQRKVPTCRTDWHQTGSHVYATFYAKNTVPEKSYVEANQVKLRINLVFEAGEALFGKEVILGGIIDVSDSQVTMAGPKVEIKLRKAEPVAWKSLELATARS